MDEDDAPNNRCDEEGKRIAFLLDKPHQKKNKEQS
jgi:hypothetical protein